MSYCCVKREGISPLKLNYEKGASTKASEDKQFIKSLARGFKSL